MDEIARNKYPEQTVERIIAASTKLFMQKGYEKTTMQDILEELKLSKGAIYHHFKSKEEILSVVIKHWHQREVALVNEFAAHIHGESGKEKMQNLLMDFLMSTKEIYGSDTEDFLRLQPQNSRLMMTGEFAMAGINLWVKDIAPIFARLIEDGVADGSLRVDYPLETSEITILLLGLWAKPTMFDRSEQQTRQRLCVLKEMLLGMGADVFTDAIIEKLIAEYRRLHFFDE